jgi:hypothetical protein
MPVVSHGGFIMNLGPLVARPSYSSAIMDFCRNGDVGIAKAWERPSREATVNQNTFREFVGVLDTEASLDAAVARLDRAALSVLGGEAPYDDKTETTCRSIWGISDDPATVIVARRHARARND